MSESQKQHNLDADEYRCCSVNGDNKVMTDSADIETVLE